MISVTEGSVTGMLRLAVGTPALSVSVSVALGRRRPRDIKDLSRTFVGSTSDWKVDDGTLVGKKGPSSERLSVTVEPLGLAESIGGLIGKDTMDPLLELRDDGMAAGSASASATPGACVKATNLEANMSF